MSTTVMFKNGGANYPFTAENLRDVFTGITVRPRVDVYSMNGRKNRFEFNDQIVREKISVLIYATPSGTEGMSEITEIKHGDEHIIFDTPLVAFPKMARSMQHVTHIVDDNGTQVAHMDEKNGVLYIPFDVFDNQNATEEEVRKVLELVIKLAQEQYFSILILRTSWSKTPDKNALTESFKETLRRRTQTQLANDKEHLGRFERDIVSYQRNLKQAYDSTIRLRNSIAMNESNASTAEQKLFKDLDAIVAHDKFEDVTIVAGKITLHTVPLYAYTKENKRYYMGKYSVEVNMDNSDVRFRGDNPRRSYWSANDPHPHVNGRSDSGTACLGNVSGTIAELCSQYELYALAMVLVDFLENVNIEDIAGKHVRNWDEVNEGGEVIVKGFVNRTVSDMDEQETFECEHCEEHYHTNDANTVWTRFDSEDGDVGREEVWCDGCRENDASYIESWELYVSDQISEEVEAYIEENGDDN